MPTPDSDSADTPRPSYEGGDYVGGRIYVSQTAGGDIVSGDKITTIIGDPAAAANWQEALARIERLIAERPDDPAVEKAEIKDTVARLSAETEKGEAANAPKVERLLHSLGGMAEDIFEVTAACLANPALGVATTIRLIAQKAQAERAKRAGGGG